MTASFDEWKRSWWILFTLVPFGWLAFVSFLYAGIKAKRNAWKLWASVYFVLSWGATVLASVEELAEPWRQGGGLLILFVAWPLPFIHALVIRRRYLEQTAPSEPTAQSLEPTEEEPAEETWRPKPRSRWLLAGFIFFTVFGLFMTLTGEGADRLWGIFTLLFFGAGGVAVYLPKGAAGGDAVGTALVSRHGRHTSGLVFPLDSRRHRVRTIASLSFGVAGLLMVVFADDMGDASTRYDPTVLLVAGGMMSVFFGGSGLVSLRRWGAIPRLALLEEGVVLEGPIPTFVPWDAIEMVGVISMRSNEMLGISVNDRRRVETGRIAKLLLPLNRWLSPAEISQPLDSFAAAPEVVVATVEHYFLHPEDRRLLSSGEAQPVKVRPRVDAAPRSDGP